MQRRIQQHFNGLAFDESHFYNAFSESTVSLYFDYHAFFACLQFRKFHIE